MVRGAGAGRGEAGAAQGQGGHVTGLHVRYVSTVSGPRADTELYPLYLDRDTVIQYVLYLIVCGLEADTDWIHCIIQQTHCVVHVGKQQDVAIQNADAPT